MSAASASVDITCQTTHASTVMPSACATVFPFHASTIQIRPVMQTTPVSDGRNMGVSSEAMPTGKNWAAAFRAVGRCIAEYKYGAHTSRVIGSAARPMSTNLMVATCASLPTEACPSAGVVLRCTMTAATASATTSRTVKPNTSV